MTACLSTRHLSTRPMSVSLVLTLLLPCPPLQEPSDPEVPDTDRRRVYVDLEEPTQVEDVDESESHVLSRPWHRNVHLSGFGAAGLLDSGNAGANCGGGAGVGTSPLIRMPERRDVCCGVRPRPAWRMSAKCEGFGEREKPLESIPPMGVGAR